MRQNCGGSGKIFVSRRYLSSFASGIAYSMPRWGWRKWIRQSWNATGPLCSLSSRRQKLLHRQASLSDQHSDGPTGDLRVVGDGKGRGSAGLGQHNVADPLPRHSPTEPLERTKNFARAKQRESGHQTATSTSRVVTVN